LESVAAATGLSCNFSAAASGNGLVYREINRVPAIEDRRLTKHPPAAAGLAQMP
jgi:hypothetical protein